MAGNSSSYSTNSKSNVYNSNYSALPFSHFFENIDKYTVCHQKKIEIGYSFNYTNSLEPNLNTSNENDYFCSYKTIFDCTVCQDICLNFANYDAQLKRN